MGSAFLESCRVRSFESIVPSDSTEHVISLLGLEAVGGRVGGFDAALTAALWHESYLYEHRADAPNLTPGVLRALETLGGSWISREMASMLVRSRHDEKPGSISRSVGEGKVVFARRVAEREDWVAHCGRYSTGLMDALPPRVRNRVFHQVAGLLCLVGAESVLRAHVDATLAGVLSGGGTDWVTVLQMAAASEGVEVDWSYDASGPDHERTFTATCTVGAGRRTSAAGPSKKAARWAAAEQLLRQYFPRETAKVARSADPPRPPLCVLREGHPGHVRAVDEIASAFRMAESAKPLISQALVHSSWAYEHQLEMTRAQQRDHGVLAFVGSHVLDYEACLAETVQVVRDAPEEYAHRTVESRTHLVAMHSIDLRRGILLGRGQRSTGVSDELGSNVFQAVMAAVYLSSAASASLFETWPEGSAWAAVAELIAPGAGRGTDVTTHVQEFVTACDLVTTYEFDRTGPDHRAEYTARLVLDSPAMQRRVRVQGSPTAGKTAAKHSASAIAVGWFNALADAEELDRIAKSGGSALAGTTFLLAHLCEIAAGRTSVPAQWRRRGLLGWTLRGQELERWAAAADQLLLRQRRVEPDVEGLASYFQLASGAADSMLPLSEALASTLRWVATIDPRDPIDGRQETRLIDLAAAYRALGGEQEPSSLAEAVEGQVLLARGKLRSEIGPKPVFAPALVISAIEALLSVILANGTRARVAAPSPGEVVLQPDDPPGLATVDLGPTIEIWRALGIPLVLDEKLGRVVLNVNGVGDRGPGPVTSAVRLATIPQPSHLAAAVANLLHDLKNQIAAAKALAASPDGGSRTAALERQLAASRHLDQAAALAERIRAASSLLRPSDGETTSLSTSLRRYASAMLVRIPPSVSLSVASGGEDLVVAMSEPALTAVLDNLVKNAVEAMADGGRVTLDWTYDDDVAVVEVTDDGPGLPDAVRAAFTSGGRIESTKPGGNGLGLLGVQSLLRRAGGNFELARSAKGTVWHLTIPLAEEFAG